MSVLQKHLATGSLAYWATFHRSKATLIIAEPGTVSLKGRVEYLHCPLREFWMKAVIDPLALTAIFQQPAGAQLSKVSGHFWLVIVERPDQFADT
ncbi:hypothetical protein BGP80_06630 [Pseudomonas putida]|uniref:Uncharacterized protein n=1 Tax=Pseudomonas putida TaxID=303 RepID=A0A2S3WAH9_PSEPU|nr:hypothetical protein BGP80_06630 [Pseudomonas putida]